jgi:hypothetical protein
MKYTVQRPVVMWVETVVEAEDKDLALDLADTNFEKGDYLEIEMSSEVDYERYWIQDDLGKEFYR